MPRDRASVRTRTTLAAVAVVAVALVVGAAVLVLTVRSSLTDAAEDLAEQQAEALVSQLEGGRSPAELAGGDGPEDECDDPEDVVWQVVGADDGALEASSRGPRCTWLPQRNGAVIRWPEEDDRYYVVSESSESGHVVTLAVSLEDVEETTAALATPLLVGLPVLLLVVGGTSWLVVGRALRPVERIRREVEQITGSRLDRRVPEPRSSDEIGRLARTMNTMLGRLEESSDRQQQFVADASHELRSPVASLRQAAEVVSAHPGAMEEGELAETVLEESIRMQVLVDQLLLLTRAGEGRAQAPREDVDLDDLVLGAVSRIGRPDLQVDTSGVGAGRVRGDVVALGQVVRNLVDNAARHATSRISIALGATGRAVVLSVDDDGPGIADAERERVFERFVRLDDARARDAGGSGLGLAIVREVVRSHGGDVAIESSTLGGARFVVRLPEGASDRSHLS